MININYIKIKNIFKHNKVVISLVLIIIILFIGIISTSVGLVVISLKSRNNLKSNNNVLASLITPCKPKFTDNFIKRLNLIKEDINKQEKLLTLPNDNSKPPKSYKVYDPTKFDSESTDPVIKNCNNFILSILSSVPPLYLVQGQGFYANNFTNFQINTNSFTRPGDSYQGYIKVDVNIVIREIVLNNLYYSTNESKLNIGFILVANNDGTIPVLKFFGTQPRP